MKKLFSKIVLLTAILLLCFSAAACSPVTGKSAYEIACENGYTGTVTEWLESLKGNDGGGAGKSAYEIACENGFTGTVTEWLESLIGKDGQDGQDGQDGKDGLDGKDGEDGQDGQNGAGFDIYTLFDAYLEYFPDSTFEEFLRSFMVADSYDIESAGAKAARSIVSVFSKFRNGTSAFATTYYSCGSGVVYRQSGGDLYIITNYHVIYDYNSRGRTDRLAEEITVHCFGYSYDSGTVASADAVRAELIGGSITKDIAVIKASAGDLPDYLKTADIEDSNSVNLGERVIAVGNPLGEGISVTSGIVSVDSEDIKMKKIDSADNSTSTVDMRVIRTDSAINGGNSGGGLFNSRGRLVGIVNAKTTGEEIDNMGYAIPVIVAAGIADCVIDNASKKLALGITLAASSSEVVYDSAKSRIEIYETVKVESVTAGGLAEGVLSAGDILVSAEISGGGYCRITRVFHLSDFLYRARSGDVLRLTVRRGGADTVLQVTAESAFFAAV